MSSITIDTIIGCPAKLFALKGKPPEVLTNNRQPLTTWYGNLYRITATNIPLQACTTLSPMASLKEMPVLWKTLPTKSKPPWFSCTRHLWNFDQHLGQGDAVHINLLKICNSRRKPMTAGWIQRTFQTCIHCQDIFISQPKVIGSGKVTQVGLEPRSCIVTLPTGATYQCN